MATNLRNIIRHAKSYLDGIDLYNVRLIPDGATEPRLAVPMDVEITPADVDRARRDWEAAFPEYAGLLDADILSQRDFD